MTANDLIEFLLELPGTAVVMAFDKLEYEREAKVEYDREANTITFYADVPLEGEQHATPAPW